MLIAAIILGMISLGLLIVALVRFLKYNEGAIPFLLGVTLGVVWLITFLFSLNFQISNQSLTGYIYSSESRVGYTTAHIRFSENAGTDAQPSFCVKSDSEAGTQIQRYVGSGKKVSVKVPSYFYFANSPFACGTTKTIIEETK